MQLLEEAGLPPGVINLLTGDGRDVSEVLLADPALAGHPLHRLDGDVPAPVVARSAPTSARYATYPRLVGETGGKDFVLAHPSRRRRRAADGAHPRRVRVPGPEVLGGVAGVRAAVGVGAAARRPGRRDRRAGDGRRRRLRQLPRRGDRPPRLRQARRGAGRWPATELDVVAGGTASDEVGFFVGPTIAVGADPTHSVFSTEYFGPILAVHVYDDGDFERVLAQVDRGAPYGAHRLGDRPRPRGRRPRVGGAAVRGGQLLRERQADRRGRRPAALRRRPGERHQRQGGLDPQPAALDEPAHAQGDPRARRPASGYPHQG